VRGECRLASEEGRKVVFSWKGKWGLGGVEGGGFG
jgi:hypothetical protein